MSRATLHGLLNKHNLQPVRVAERFSPESQLTRLTAVVMEGFAVPSVKYAFIRNAHHARQNPIYPRNLPDVVSGLKWASLALLSMVSNRTHFRNKGLEL